MTPNSKRPQGLKPSNSTVVAESANVRGLIERDFARVAEYGFGDPQNTYPHSMVWFRDHLYVGTSRGNLAHAGKQRLVKTGLDSVEIWPVPLPVESFDIDLRAEIWRYDPRRNEWVRLFQAPWVTGKDGYDVPLSIGFRTMAVYQGKSDPVPVLYCPTWGSHQTPYTTLLKCVDGEHFSVVSEPGMGMPDPKPRCLRGFVIFRNKLFTSPGMGQARMHSNTAGFMTIMVSDDPSKDKWDYACEPHFGNPNNQTAFQLAVFNDHLYAGTLNVNEGFEVWKTRGEGSPPYKWTRVLTQGAYRGKLNQVAMTFREFNGHLYVGTAIQGGGIDADNKVGPAAAEILRIAPDDSWDLIVGEPRYTPDGLKIPLSDLGPGFNNMFAGYHWAMEVHEGWLYLGNAVWTLFTKYLKDGEHLPESVRGTLKYLDRETLVNRQGGCQLWRTRDGHRWKPVTLNGFGNYYNMGIRTMKSTPYGLFVGTTNPFGPEIGIKRLAGWKYEGNPKGGLEIWLGMRSDARQESADEDTAQTVGRVFRGTQLSVIEGTVHSSRAMDLFATMYKPGDFRHPGFWTEAITTPHLACENLISELLALTQRQSKKWVDIGCGLGATTGFLSTLAPREALTGICEDKNLVSACRTSVSSAKFIASHLPALKLGDVSVDCAMWAKGEGALGSRARLLSEVFRILRPGGELVFFDFVVPASAERSGIQPLWSCEKSFVSVEDVERQLQKAGFTQIVVFDVTWQTLEGFKHHAECYFKTCVLAGVASQDEVEELRTRLAAASMLIEKCVICHAVKPAPT
ncbi:MAG: methyltransferase domain-containing protein [Halioglobus sp.]|nr:methyltransferase domain-containing protein [Halioglobus sp.]